MAVPFARRIARFNHHVTNRILDPIVWFLPGFGRVDHVGRRTGRLHVAPMMGFPSRDGRTMTFALTYGPEAHWVQNALAAGRFGYRTRQGGRLELVEPRVYRDRARRAMPAPIRIPLRILGVDDFLVATVADQAGTAAR
jgi:hypothetical protein